MDLRIIIITLFLEMFVCFLALYRNKWVFRQRMNLINTRLSEYYDFLSYDEMLNKFLVWDINKLKKQ